MSIQTFELMVISPPEEYAQETERVNQLFAHGLETFHLRKPGWNLEQLLQYLEKVEEEYHSRIMVHYQETVIREVAIKGIHFRLDELPLQKPPYTVSCGVHSWREHLEVSNRVDYAWISPFFDSISKEGYQANQQLFQIPETADKRKGVALGGIEADNIGKMKSLGLKGVAVLGAIWKAADPIKAFLHLKELRKDSSSHT